MPLQPGIVNELAAFALRAAWSGMRKYILLVLSGACATMPPRPIAPVSYACGELALVRSDAILEIAGDRGLLTAYTLHVQLYERVQPTHDPVKLTGSTVEDAPMKVGQMHQKLPLTCCAIALGCSAPPAVATNTQDRTQVRQSPIVKLRTRHLGQGPPTRDNSNITFHGGRTLQEAHSYVIWYGEWTDEKRMSLVTDFLRALSYTPRLKTDGSYIANFIGNVQFLKATDKLYLHGSPDEGNHLGDTQFRNILSRAFVLPEPYGIPFDPDGIYFIIPHQDVQVDGFCTDFCGYHKTAQIQYKNAEYNVPYAFIGVPVNCMDACAEQSNVSPNGDPVADAMVSVITHELDETLTDTDGDGWWSTQGENADLCAWMFGSEYKTANGAEANVQIGARDYLLQQNWVYSTSDGGHCGMTPQ